jgi:hypothetical protein
MTLDPFVKEREKKGKDVREKKIVTLLAVAVFLACVDATAKAQASNRSTIVANQFAGSNLACTQSAPESSHIQVAPSLVERAKLKAHLASLLTQSLYDDAKGVVNIAREKEIKKLANKLRAEN